MNQNLTKLTTADQPRHRAEYRRMNEHEAEQLADLVAQEWETDQNCGSSTVRAPGGDAYATSSSGPLWWVKPGYQRAKSAAGSSLRTRVWIGRNRWAPCDDQRICCFLTMGLDTTRALFNTDH